MSILITSSAALKAFLLRYICAFAPSLKCQLHPSGTSLSCYLQIVVVKNSLQLYRNDIPLRWLVLNVEVMGFVRLLFGS